MLNLILCHFSQIKSILFLVNFGELLEFERKNMLENEKVLGSWCLISKL